MEDGRMGKLLVFIWLLTDDLTDLGLDFLHRTC